MEKRGQKQERNEGDGNVGGRVGGVGVEPGCRLTQETHPPPLLMKVNGTRFQEGPMLGRVLLSCNIN